MKRVLPIAKFPHKVFGIIAVVMLIAFLFSMKPVAEFVKKLVEQVGIKFPPVEVFQEANNNVLYATAGLLIVIIGLAVIYPIVKISLIVVGLSFIAYSGYKLFKNLFPSYGNNDLTKQ